MIKGLYEAHLPVRNLQRSIEFYLKLNLEIAYQSDQLVFFWIEKGKSWIGLWETAQVNIPYHASIRHIALTIDKDDMYQAKKWLEVRGIQVKTSFGFTSDNQPLVLPNNRQAHAAIYFDDPDGNSIEFISPLRLDVEEEFKMMSLEDWDLRGKQISAD
ncbi:catechol-2,3-dioxygenase [Cytobacillus purgationiresistens]|uniref:Catechol-2,3-dioxygenase n=1 Tax=Cytobacillus purgationiresistens TaxID=863449 RepID=A0ABU0AKU9_9BACI|nr:VOC family protein [Cytobacillus purgationiresistens]MDQ0271665.1 catechol-2,3-dioxygenase [Cytobacillus purgationiresistens]